MAMMASRKISTCWTESPDSSRCSDLRQTASYSIARGTLSNSVACRCRTARIMAADAPAGLRTAATTASVSITRLTSPTISHCGRCHSAFRSFRPLACGEHLLHPPSESAGTLVSGVVSLGAPTWCEPQADAHLRRTRLCRQARESGVDGSDRRRQNRTGLRPSVEGFAERPSLTVYPCAGSVRRDVRLAGRPLHAPVTQSPGPPGRPVDR